MQMNLIDCFFLFSLIPALEGSEMLWKMNEFGSLERTVKTILESCYQNDSSSNPILILGDFNEFIENSSIIRIDISAGAAFPIEKPYGQSDFKASRIVLVDDSPQKLYDNLEKLFRMNWWNHMTSFLIIAKYNRGCEHPMYFLNLSWSVDMIDSIYICSESRNSSTLYTLNLMANYAPYPWERIEEPNNLNVFRQVFDQRISCENLNFDKTRNLNGYELKVIRHLDPHLGSFPPSDDHEFETLDRFRQKPLRAIIIALNVSVKFTDESTALAIEKRWQYNDLDITSSCFTLWTIPGNKCFLVLYKPEKIIGVVRLKPEVTTLLKIFKLWSPLVLIGAAITLALLLLILTIKNHDFSLAMLDITRLLTYTSIQTNVRTHAFRIYFTTMLIFMVISNGVFQGKIAAFLTTQERASAIGTINELADLGYRMFAVGSWETIFNKKCSKCNFKPASSQECIEYVLNNTYHLCLIWEDEYFANYSELELDYIPEVLSHDFGVYGCRYRWPLANRFSDGFSRLFQTGIMDYWGRRQTEVPKQKRIAREAEWSSAQYRPVKLYKLKFAFQVLVLGLSVSTIVLIWELRQGVYETTRKSSIVQPIRRHRRNSTTKEMIRSLRYRRSVVLNGYFSKYPLTIRQDFMSRVGGIS